MNTFRVIHENGYDDIEAERAFVDFNGTLRFYNVMDKHALAQFAPGYWRSYNKKVCDVCKN